jgi:ABC-type transport system involved in cytochrome c biogenesis permease component
MDLVIGIFVGIVIGPIIWIGFILAVLLIHDGIYKDNHDFDDFMR